MTTKDEMKNLEKVQRFREQEECQYGVAPDADGQYIDRDEAIAAARLDIDAARAEGYRQGVEDGKCLSLLLVASWFLKRARISKQCAGLNHAVMYDMGEFIALRNRAFRGARGIDRAEIRQRLERMERGK